MPYGQRAEMRTRIHSSHIGIEGCLRRARECLFWPGMMAEIREYISTCETCCKYQQDQTPESLMPHEMPDRPWKRVGVDLFTVHNNDYLITVDYFSNFWELDLLSDTKLATVVRRLKSQFARYGIPDQLISDNGPQFIGEGFRAFSKA